MNIFWAGRLLRMTCLSKTSSITRKRENSLRQVLPGYYFASVEQNVRNGPVNKMFEILKSGLTVHPCYLCQPQSSSFDRPDTCCGSRNDGYGSWWLGRAQPTVSDLTNPCMS